ncbi:TPA: YoaK family small membrane protein [Klebsiella quasipneumoniae subsp. similipneumoniae]|nr:YoaK family small membrane protein [Klebsiella quasipneumoniae subsp. similipneumoniae]
MKIGIVFLVVVFIVAVALLTWFVFGGYVTPGG